ncbi:MAG: NADH-quinone oxidoreductase subunit H [Acidobacteriota bacterium]|nr:NADH-quinone oxidoreductase subunit H [Acidobacteriota bacterium]MDE3146466.1 NADH-quinone oxidoreductase subunit H [Acidobacteriota bacterium]
MGVTSWYAWASTLLQVAAVAVGGPLLMGLMAKVKARSEGRVGAPVVQPLRDLRKLLGKERLHARHSSVVLALAPMVILASTAMAVAISPLVSTRPLLSTSGDILVIVYLLLTGSAAAALGGLDVATAFGGMGASRAMTIGALAEPALLVAVIAMSIQSRTSNLGGIVSATLAHPDWVLGPSRLLALGALVIVVIAETGRIPVDNPATHLELTMIHEAMVLEYAGPELAVTSLGEAMRLGLLFSLVANLIVPWGIATRPTALALVAGVVFLGLKAAAVALGVALIEVRSAKLRLFRLPELLAGGFVLSVLAVVTGLVAR